MYGTDVSLAFLNCWKLQLMYGQNDHWRSFVESFTLYSKLPNPTQPNPISSRYLNSVNRETFVEIIGLTGSYYWHGINRNNFFFLKKHWIDWVNSLFGKIILLTSSNFMVKMKKKNWPSDLQSDALLARQLDNNNLKNDYSWYRWTFWVFDCEKIKLLSMKLFFSLQLLIYWI